jgi:putative ABC transport system ATP-binding protein
MIELNDIYYSYPNSDFDLRIPALSMEKGKKTAFIGPSGFGKTTLLNLIAGILLPQQGEIRVQGQKINALKENERRNYRIQQIGFVFQDFKLLEYLTVLDNILLPFRINKVLQVSRDIVDRARQIAESLNIADKLPKHPSKLSHGERQRVAICRALLNKPSIILADEPTGNLDPDNKAHIIEILFEYVNLYDSTLITVTHDHELLDGFDGIVDFQELRQKEK